MAMSRILKSQIKDVRKDINFLMGQKDMEFHCIALRVQSLIELVEDALKERKT